ncbi:hypothetical protein KI387_025488, partial [Taxus chinensis]
MGDSVMEKDRILDLLGESSLEEHSDEEESNEIQLEHTCTKKEKGNMVCVMNGKEMENWDVNHIV